MPFDGTDFPPPRDDGEHRPANDNLVTFLIIAIATLLLVTPISLAALADIARALRPG